MVQISYSVTIHTDQRIDVETLFRELSMLIHMPESLGLTNPKLWLLCICDALEIYIICHLMFGIGLVTFYLLASVYAL
jgi:hypothetical protein